MKVMPSVTSPRRITRTTPKRSIAAPTNGASSPETPKVMAVVRLTSAAVAPKVSMNRGNRFWGTNSAMPFVKK